MSTFKKTVFLSNKESKVKGMATLTLEKKGTGIFCTLKSFNFDEKYQNLVLGLKSDDKIIKQNIKFNDNVYNFILNQNLDLEKSVGCVLMNVTDSSISPIIWGSEKSENYKTQIVNKMKASIENLSFPSNYSPKKPSTTPKIDNQDMSPNIQKSNLESDPYPDTYEQVFSKIMGKTPDYTEQLSMDTETMSFRPKDSHEVAQTASMADLFENSDEEINKQIDSELNEIPTGNSKEHKFYSMIADQLEELFDKYPREIGLQNLVENSRWVKITDEDNDRNYVVGIIYLDNDIKYICYGVPGSYYSEPPRELKNYSQWLPSDTTNPYENGYWVMYQDADTGENVMVN